MTLNDLERRNGPYFAFSPNSIALLSNYVKKSWNGNFSAIAELLVSFSERDEAMVFIMEVAWGRDRFPIVAM